MAGKTSDGGSAGDGGPADRPAIRLSVAVVVAAEAALLVVAAVFVGVQAVTGAPADRKAALALAGLTLVAGAGLALIGRGVWQAQRWARAPVLTWQVVQAAAAGPAMGSRWYVAVPLLVASLVAGAGVMLPGVLPVERTAGSPGGPGGARP